MITHLFQDVFEKNVVPWFCKAEWEDVFEKVYSNDIALQDEAYRRMCIWKMRCPKLPVGVECTTEILQIYLFHKKCNDVDYSKKDLQLMYSTTLMRFVNQVTHLFNNKLNRTHTCYEIAKMYGIPDWIVNIRHDAAHQNVLPSVELLNTAAAFALDWLYTNYWTLEAKEARDLVLESSPVASGTERKIKLLLNLWQSCKLYKFADYHTVGAVPNSYLRSLLFSLKQEKNFLNEDITDQSCDLSSLDSSFTLEIYLTNDGSIEKGSVKLTEVLKFLIGYLKTLFPADLRNDDRTKDIFIKSLIQCDLFLPASYNHDFYSDGSKISRSLSSLWRDVLEVYHNYNLMADLLSELAEISLVDNIQSRQLVAACWIAHITESLCNPCVETVINENIKQNRKFAFAFMKRNKEWQNCDDDREFQQITNLNLCRSVTLNYHVVENIVNRVIMSPNQFTVLYLSSLLNLMNPPLEPLARNKIVQLVETYVDTKECAPTSDIIYTPEMIPGFNTIEYNSTEENNTEEMFESGSIWSKKYGAYDWASCPLGRLPQCSESD